jgi:hypothetical protein
LPTALGLHCLPDAVVTRRKPASIHRLAIAAGKIKMPSQLRNCSRHLGERSLSKIQYPHIALLAGAISRRKEGLALTKINKGGTSKTSSRRVRSTRKVQAASTKLDSALAGMTGDDAKLAADSKAV